MILNHDCFRAILLYIEDKCVYEEIKNKKRMHEVSYYELINAESLSVFDDNDIHYIVSKLKKMFNIPQ